jgi:multidrug efflux system membrane fusion protein
VNFSNYPRKRAGEVACGLLLLAAAVLVMQGCAKTEDAASQGGGKKGKKGGDGGPVPVEVATVVRRDVPIDLTAVGNVEAYSTVSIRSQINGQLEKVFVEDGQYVTKNQKLFQIDPRPLQAQVAQAEATMARDRAQLGQAQANLARDIANEKYARENAQRYQALFKEGVVSRDDQDRLASTADAQTQLVLADKAAIESAQAQIQADEANLGNIKLQLSFTTIFAPIDGRAGNVSVKAGNIITASQTEMLSIAQVEPIYVTFAVPESRLGEIQRYMATSKLAVEATGQDQINEVEHGVLTFIDNNVDSTTGTIKLKGTFQNTDHKLWPGEYANVTLKLSTQANALVIPSQAVQTGQDGSYVYVVKDDRTVDARNVTLGLRRETEVVVDKGLSDGEIVVTQGQLRLAPGSRVNMPGEAGRRPRPGV